MKKEMMQHKAKQLRYRKAIVKDLNLDAIQEDLYDISTECDSVKWYFDSEDGSDTLINAMDGDEDDVYEFKMMFADLCAECEQMDDDLRNEYVPEFFDDFFVGIGAGNQGGGLLGWDSYEQDYFGIGLAGDLAEKESEKRLMRLKKEDFIDGAHICFKVLYAYLGIRHRYDCLKAAMDILKDENTGYLQMVKKIDETYDKAAEDNFYSWYESTKEFEKLIRCMPAEAWIQ